MQADLFRALRAVIRVLTSLSVPYRVGGSMASSAFGAARSTLDVDVMADVREEHVEPMAEALAQDFYVDSVAIRRALKDRSSFNVLDLKTGAKVDVFVPKARAFDREALRRGVRVSLPGTDPNEALDFVTPEDIVLLKLEWYRKGGESSERQWGDVVSVLRLHAGRLDDAHLDRWARELGVPDLLERALRAAKEAG